MSTSVSPKDPPGNSSVEFPLPPRTATDIKKALVNLKKPLTRNQRAVVERANLNSLDDPCGDGDQSPISDTTTPEFIALMKRDVETASKVNLKASMPMRLAVRTGLDRMKPFDDATGGTRISFHKLCEIGAAKAAYSILGMAQAAVIRGYSREVIELLERRVSLMRWSALHYCCFGATIYTNVDEETRARMPMEVFQFVETAKLLCREGARLDAKDIAGNTPIAIAAGETATKESLELVQLLVNMGANININNRYGDSIMVEATVTQNEAALQTLLDAGADGRAEDNVGMPVYAKALGTPLMGRVWVNHVRENVLKNEKCGSCGMGGASKFCSKCRKVYYCSRECQVKAWKSGHKAECGKEENEEDYLDLVVETMTFRKEEPDVQKIVKEVKVDPNKAFTPMQPKEFGVPFRVFIFLHEAPNGNRECHLVNIAAKGGNFWLKKVGPGRAVSERFIDLVQAKADPGLAKTLFFLGKWIEPVEYTENGRKKMSNVLRIDISKVLPPLKPISGPVPAFSPSSLPSIDF